MSTLESVDIQSNCQWSEDKNCECKSTFIHNFLNKVNVSSYSVMHLSQDTSWLSPQKATLQEMDPLQSELTFNIQTSPISILVGSSLHTPLIPTRKSESPTRSTNQSAKHGNVRRANSELLENGPRKPLSILPISSTATRDISQSAASMDGSNNDSRQLVDNLDNLPMPVMNDGLSIEPANMSQVTSSASDGLQIRNYTQLDVSGGPSSVRLSY